MKAFLQRLLDLYVKTFTGLPRKVWLLSLVMLINRSGAMVVAFLSVYLIDKQDYAPITAGYVMAAFGAGGVLGNYLGGLLNDRYGSWHIQFYSMLGAGVLNVALGQVSAFWALCGLAFSISLVADAFRPANRAAIAIYAPEGRLMQCYGLQRLAVNLGFSIGPALGGYLIYNYGFELMFWGDGLTFILAGIIFRFAIPPDETARPLVQREEATGGAMGGGIARAQTTPAHRQSWLLTFAVANMFLMFCFFQLFSTFPPYLKTGGFDERHVGWLFTISGIFIVLAEMPALYVIERRYKPIPVMLLGGSLIALAFFLLPPALFTGFGALLTMMMILTLGEIFYMPLTNAYISAHAPAARRGEYLGLLSASYSAAFVLTPLVGFAVAEWYSYTAACLLSATVCVLGVGLMWLSNRVRERAEAPSTLAAPGL